MPGIQPQIRPWEPPGSSRRANQGRAGGRSLHHETALRLVDLDGTGSLVDDEIAFFRGHRPICFAKCSPKVVSLGGVLPTATFSGMLSTERSLESIP